MFSNSAPYIFLYEQYQYNYYVKVVPDIGNRIDIPEGQRLGYDRRDYRADRTCKRKGDENT